MDSNTRPLYLVLGIPSDASVEEIRRAYRRLALKYHPDKAGADNAEAAEKFQQILAAYTLLSDPEARQVYDRYGEQGLTNIESVPVMAEVAHIMCAVLFFRVTFAVMAILSVLGFICCLLVALKVDYDKKWSWVVVAIPAFAAGIIILVVVIISMCLRVNKYRSWYKATKQCRYYNDKNNTTHSGKSPNEDGGKEMGQNDGAQNRNSKSKAGGGKKGGSCRYPVLPTCICNFNNILPSGTTGTQCTCGAYAAAQRSQQQQQQQQHSSAGQTASGKGNQTNKGCFFGFGVNKKSCSAGTGHGNSNGEGAKVDPSTPLTPAAGSPDDLCRPACAINKCLIVQQVTFWVRHISILCSLMTFAMLADVLQKELAGKKSPLSWPAVFGPVFVGSLLSVVSVGQFRDVLRLRGVHEMCSWMLGIMNIIGFAMFGVRTIQIIILPMQLEGIISWRPIFVGLPSIIYVSLRCMLCICLEVSRVRGLERFRARNNPLEKQDCATTNLTTGETQERPVVHKKAKKNNVKRSNRHDSSDVRKSDAVVSEDRSEVSGSGRTQQQHGSSGSSSNKTNPPRAQAKSIRKKRDEGHTAAVDIDDGGGSGSAEGIHVPNENDEKRDTNLDDSKEGEEEEKETVKPYVSAYKQPSFIIQTTLEIVVHVLIVASIVMCVLKANGCESISMTVALAPLYVLFAMLAIVATTLYTCFAIYVSTVKADEKKKRAEAEREQIRREREVRKEKKRRERENFAAPRGPFGFNPQAWNSRHRPRHYSRDNTNNNLNDNSFTTNSNSNGNSLFHFYNNNNTNNHQSKHVNDWVNSASEGEGGGPRRKVSTAGFGGGGGGSYSSLGGPTQSFFVPSLSADGAFEEAGGGNGSTTPSGLHFGASGGDDEYDNNNNFSQQNQHVPRRGRTSYNNAAELDDESQGQEMYSARHMNSRHDVCNDDDNIYIPSANDDIHVNNPISSMSAYGSGVGGNSNDNGARQDLRRMNAAITARGSLAPTTSKTATPHTPRKLGGFGGFDDGENFAEEVQQQEQIFTEEPQAQWGGRRRASPSVTPLMPQHQLKEHEQEGEVEMASPRATSSEGPASPSEYDSLLSEVNRAAGGAGAEPRKKESRVGRSIDQFMYENNNENPLFAGGVSPPPPHLSYSSASRRHNSSSIHTNNNAAQQEIPCCISFGEPTARLSVYKRGGVNASVGFGFVGASLAQSFPERERGTTTFNNSFLSGVSPLTPPHVE